MMTAFHAASPLTDHSSSAKTIEYRLLRGKPRGVQGLETAGRAHLFAPAQPTSEAELAPGNAVRGGLHHSCLTSSGAKAADPRSRSLLSALGGSAACTHQRAWLRELVSKAPCLEPGGAPSPQSPRHGAAIIVIDADGQLANAGELAERLAEAIGGGM